MVFKTEEQLFDYIRANQSLNKWVADARVYHKRLLALIDGEGFKELLITQVEHIEGSQKAIARKKYARSIKDFYERLLRLTDNIYSSTGGVKRYENLTDSQVEELQEHLHNVKGGKTLESWLETIWLTVYHQDPNGIIFLEYDAQEGIKPRPSYKSINTIRNYVSDGQTLEKIIFEPVDLENGAKQWRIVDDKFDYIVHQTSKDAFVIIKSLTFEHNFGIVPAVVNSDIEHIGHDKRLSPVDKVIELSEEYGRDLSVKTIYKFQQGFPKHWRYGSNCTTCHGTGKDGNNTCGDCHGTGELKKGDVTNEDVFTVPEEGDSIITPGSGFVSPDLEYLADTRIELKELEDTATFTHWGAVVNTEAVATATEIVINTQPVTMRLNKYADVAERVETLLTEMIANNMFLDKPKDVKVSSIHLGRNYILETMNAVLERYQLSKEKGDNSTILDRLYQEYLLTKHKGDNVGLQIAITKSKVDYYLHYTVEQVKEVVNDKEAERKVLFDEWWKTITKFDQTSEVLRTQFDAWFQTKYEPPVIEETGTN